MGSAVIALLPNKFELSRFPLHTHIFSFQNKFCFIFLAINIQQRENKKYS